MITKGDVFNLLKNLGLRHDDKITIHCSLRAIGQIENGADGLIDAFCEYLYDGLFIVPTHTWSVVTKDNPFYDVNKTEPCIGTLPKVAAFRKDGIRSLHPTHSVTAFGKIAKEFVCGEEKSATPAPVGCCLSRLYEENGKILLIGVGLERNTYIHAVEERINIPDRLSKDTFEITIKDHNRNLIKSPPFRPHCVLEGPHKSISEYYPNYKKAFEYAKAIKYSILGNALVYCCDARKITHVMQSIWEKSKQDLCFSLTPIPEKYYK